MVQHQMHGHVVFRNSTKIPMEEAIESWQFCIIC